MINVFIVVALATIACEQVIGFGISSLLSSSSSSLTRRMSFMGSNNLQGNYQPTSFESQRYKQKSTFTTLQMSDAGGGGGTTERVKSTKKGVSTIVIDKTETKAKEKIKDEDMWRVLLHNDEVHTFQYVVQSLIKVVGTIDRKQAFEICVTTHNSGKGTVTKAWKAQAEKFCLGLQRQGLTVSIAPDKRFKGGGGGGDDDDDGDDGDDFGGDE